MRLGEGVRQLSQVQRNQLKELNLKKKKHKEMMLKRMKSRL